MGASSVGTQFKCSLWRHYLGHLRQWPWVLGALVVALTPFALLAGLKSTAPPEHVKACHFEARGLSTEWPLGQLQSFVCGLSNECHDEGQDDLLDHYPGAAVNELINATYLINGTSSTMLDRLFALPWSLNLLKDVTGLITAPALTTLMENGVQVSDIVKSPSELTLKLTSVHDLDPEVVRAFLASRINVSRVFSLAEVRGPKEVVCSPEYLGEFLVTNDTDLVKDISWSLCHLPLSQAANVTAVFLSSLDSTKLMHKVGDIMGAVGGYNAEVLMRQVRSLVDAAGRLEALTSLRTSMAPVLSALNPARSAIKILSLSMWDEVSLGDFLGFVEEVLKAFTTDSSKVMTKALHEATDAARHLLSIAENPANITHQMESPGDPWEAVLKEVGVATEALVAKMEVVPNFLRQHPFLRSLLSFTSTGISVLLHEEQQNTTRLEEELDEVLTSLLEEYHIPFNNTFIISIRPIMESAAAFTMAVDVMLSLVMEEPPLPLHPSLGLLTLLSNCSQLKDAIEGEGLDSWLCDGESLDHLTLDDQNTLSDRLCTDDGKTKLQRTTELLQTALNFAQETQSNFTVSDAVKSFSKLLRNIDFFIHYRKAAYLNGNMSTSTRDLEWWRRWYPEPMVVTEVDGNGNAIQPLLPLLPPLGSEGFQDLKEGVTDSKAVIRRLVTIYFNLVGGECGDASGALASILSPQHLANIEDMTTSVLDTLVHVAAVTQDPWRPGDLLRHPNVTYFLTRVLPPNVMMVVTRALEIAQYPWMTVPAPIPQILALLNATDAALTSVLETGNFWAWCEEGSCPHLANVTSYAHLLPHLAALTYYSSQVAPDKAKMEIWTNHTAWRYYPCQNTSSSNPTPASLTLLYPAISAFTPTSQPIVEGVKGDVRDLEEYVCGNFDAIVDELTSNEGLTSAVKAFMDRLNPERINLGAAIGTLRSLWGTMVHFRPNSHEITNLPGGSLTLEDWKKPYSYLAGNNTGAKRVLTVAMEGVLDRLLKEGQWNGTHFFYRPINIGLQAAHNITTALTDTLKGNITLAELIGLSEADPIFSLLVQGPQGLADYLLHEINSSVITAIMDRDVDGWATGLCNRSMGRSPWVEMVCDCIYGHPAPDFLWSNLSTTVMEAITQIQGRGEPKPPPMSLSQLLTDMESLMKAVRHIDFTKPPDVSALDLLVATGRNEVDRLLAGLRALQNDWPFLLLDALVQKGPMEVKAVVRETNFILSLLSRNLQSLSDNNTSSTTELYQLLNTTWVDLLAGIHYNLHQNLSLETLNVCSPNSSILMEPKDSDGSFLEAVGKLCQFLKTHNDVFEDIMYLRNTSTPLPSTKELYHKTVRLVLRVRGHFDAARNKGLQDTLGWPSYFVMDNWRTLLTRIYPNTADGITTQDMEELVPSLVVALQWLGLPQNSTFPRQIILQMKWMDLMLAEDLKAVLNTSSVLSGLVDTITKTSPLAVKDIVHTLTNQPDEVGEALVALKDVKSWMEFCQFNTSALGSNVTALLEELCQVEEGELIGDLRSLLGLDLLQYPDPTMSLEDTLRSLMAYITTLDKMERVRTPSSLVTYLGLQRWMDLPSDAFNNVTVDKMGTDSTIILAGVLGPLVDQGQQLTRTREGTIIRTLLITIGAYVRQTRWMLVMSSGNLREAYIDKPMVIHFFDLLDQLPEIFKEYVTTYGQYSTLLEAVSMRTRQPCPIHIALLEKRAEEEVGEEGKEGIRLLNNTIQFFCEPSTQRFLWEQLLPNTQPVIMGQQMPLDAATLAHQMNDVWMAVKGLLEGQQERVVFTRPPWLAVGRWEGVYHQLRDLVDRPLAEMVLDGVFLGLSATQTHVRALWVRDTLPTAAAVAYQLLHRLADSINGMSGRVDLRVAAKGLGSVEELMSHMAHRVPTYVALAMWFPDSYANWRLIRGDHLFEMLDEMCVRGPQYLLLHPGLPQQDWEAIQHMFCNFTLPQLRDDLLPLLNVTEVMDSEVVDFSKVKEAVDQLVVKLSVLHLHQLQEPFIHNAFIDKAKRVHPMLRVLQSMQAQLVWLMRGSYDFHERAPQSYRYTVGRSVVRSIVRNIVAMQPITKEGAPSLVERLVDPDQFVQLVKDYQNLQLNISDANIYLEQTDYEHSDDLFARPFIDLHEAFINLTESLVPPSGLRMSFGRLLQSTLKNALQNGGEVMKIPRNTLCSYHVFGKNWASASRLVKLGERQLLERMEEHVDLLCRAPTSNLTQLMRSLWEDLGWEDEVTQAITAGQDWNNNHIGCTALMNQMITTYDKIVEVVGHYERDEAARTRITSCLSAAANSDAGQQLIGLVMAAEDFLMSVSRSENLTRAFSTTFNSMPRIARALRTLASRVAVMVPLQEVLVRDYEQFQNLNMDTRVLKATRNLLVDVNRIYPGDTEELAALSKTLDGMKKWLKVLEGADSGLTWDPEEKETPLEVLFKFAKSRGADTFASGLLDNVNYAYLLTEVDNMRMKAVLSLAWLDPIITHLTQATDSLTALSKSGSIDDLKKMMTGEEDPLTFLSGSVEFIQMEQWKQLAQSFQGLLEDGVPLLTGSQLGEDLESIVEGVNSILAARDMGLLDFNVPITSLVVNWTEMEDYLLKDLGMEAKVVEALGSSELNLLALLSLEGKTVEEVLCESQQMGRLVVLPNDTQVTPAQLSAALCSSSDAQAIASSFLSHLNVTPLMTMLTKFGVNASLSSHGVSLGEVAEAVRNVAEASEYMPTIITTLRAFQNLSSSLLAPPKAERLVANGTAATIGNITSPEFLERAGQALCGRPLKLMPDKFRLQELKRKTPSANRALGVCERLYEDIRTLPGGGLVLHYIKPLLTGKIFFTPDNSITRAIIAKANKTFEEVDQQRQHLKKLSDGAKGMSTSIYTELDLQKLEKALKLPWVQGAMKELLHSSPLSAYNFSSLSAIASLTEKLKESSPQLLESSQLVREFSDVLEVGVNLMSCLQLQRFVPVNNESQLLEEARWALDRREFLAGVVFKGVGESGSTETILPPDLTYTIRVDYSKSPPTFLLGPKFWRPGPYADIAFYMRYQQGFIQLQETLERAILKLHHQQAKAGEAGMGQRRKRSAGSPMPLTEEEEDALLNMPLHTKQQPYPCYTKDDFLQMVNESPVMSFIFSFLSLVLFSTFIIQQLVQERESRNKQLQEVMGLRMWLDDLVWLLCSLLLLFIIVLVSALVLNFGDLQPRADFGVVMFFLFCYGLSVVSFCYLVACLVPTTVLAVFTGVMSLLVFNIPFVSISVIQAHIPLTAVLLTCLLPSTAFGFGFRIICQYELVEEGANHSNMWIPPTKGSEMTLGLAITMLLLDTVLFFVITLITTYLRNDVSRQRLRQSGDGSEGAPKRSSFLQHFTSKRSNEFSLNVFPAYRAMDSPDAFPDSRVSPSQDDVTSIKKEAIHVVDLDLGLKQSLHKGLSITGLRKIYHQGGSESRVAVDSLTLDLYEGQVLALLGHNGAGKTTIISMLTHEVKPTAGSILVYGHDISTSEGWGKARQMIGLCPQESILFPILTVEETLSYYTTLKQHATDPPPTKISTVLANMDLLEHRTFLAHQLSEGLRRRLCMALAFVGHSKLVVLDEPTSGIDPATRSAMWEVISNNRNGRTILLTTHHLDEAETLADRVAVLHKGRLMCVGPPLALKSEYGLGYSITLSNASPSSAVARAEIKTDNLHAFTEKTSLSYSEMPFKVLKTSNDGFGVKDGGDGSGKDRVWELLTQYVPNVRLLESVNGEVTYSLPIQDSLGNTNRLPELFGEIECRLDELGYTSMELRPTSLEDVIISLNTINAFEKTSNRSSIKVEPLTSQKDLTSSYDFSLEHAECCVGLRRMVALLHKRLLHHGRDWHFYVQMFILPFLFILLAMVASKLRPSFSKALPITLEPSLYPPPATTFLRTLDPILGPLAEEVTQLSLGLNNKTGNWSSCPEFVSDTNPGLEQCSVTGSSVRSGCQCVEDRCVVDATGQPNLNDWILATRTDHVQTRHAGITLGVKDPRQGEAGRSGAMVWYDNAAYHALPTYINLVNNAKLRRLVGPGHTITAVNHPIVFTMHGIWSMSIQQHVADLGIGLLVLVALTVVCSATVGCMVAERVRGERRLLHLAGLSKSIYWISSALWDTGVVVVNILLMSLIFVAFKEQQFIWRDNLWAFVIMALLYSLSVLPLYYLMEGWFKTEASAVFFFFCSFFGVGLITTLLLVVCQVMSYIKGMNDTAAVIKYVFLVFPPFTFTCSLKDMAASYTRASIMARFDMDLYQSPFTWDPELQGGLGVYMVALGLWAVVGWLLLLCPRPASNPAPLPLVGEAEEDKDVAAERIKIQCGGTSLYDTVLRLVGLGKDFSSPHITAVSNLFLALRRGECFSLLGLNGAGKTTTFRCLTGDLQPSRGHILMNGLLLEEALNLPRPILSYCPQSHALDPNLTPREVLTNMARIRGAAGHRTKKVVEQAIKHLGLSTDANTFVRHLSGGNKRKLSVALSLLGNPLLVLMDEPTTGMDPSSRRLVWRAIQSVSQDGRSVLLTSHSMDEVNQLSHRMAIMVNGQFVCLGSPHYLKDRLGDKYTVRLKTRDIEDMTYVVDYLRSHLTEVLLKEQHHLSLVVEVSRRLPLQLIFDTLNGAKSLGVTEYDVSQTTLNEVFRVLTSHQGDGFNSLPVRRVSQGRDSVPSLHPHLHPAGIKPLAKDPTFQHQPVLSPVECANPTHPYGSFGDLFGKSGTPSTESGSANDSPEEVWTHF